MSIKLDKLILRHFKPLIGNRVIAIVQDEEYDEGNMPMLGLRFEDGVVAWILCDGLGKNRAPHRADPNRRS